MRFEIVTLPISELKHAPYNPRKPLTLGAPMHASLLASVARFGNVQPIVWNKGTGYVVGGHQRLEVLRMLGHTEVQAIVVDLSLTDEKALNLALNQIRGDWDQAKLAGVLDDLVKTPDLNIEITGFDLPEARSLIDGVLGSTPELRAEHFDPEAELDKAAPVVTRTGDLIALGAHRLLCGDSTDPVQVKRLMNGERAILFATDPPYMVGYDGSNHPGEDGAAKNSGGPAARITWDDKEPNTALLMGYLRAAVGEALLPNAAWYCWHASRRQALVEAAWARAGAFVHCQIVWVKNRPVFSRARYAWQHEPCFFGWMRGHMPPETSEPMRSTVWEIDTLAKGPDRPDHPTPKPLEVFESPMRQHTRPGEVCYEPFCGSGTQIIAAERLGRRCFAIEISPRYCDLIVRRFIAFAGAEAVSPEVVEKYAVAAEARP